MKCVACKKNEAPMAYGLCDPCLQAITWPPESDTDHILKAINEAHLIELEQLRVLNEGITKLVEGINQIARTLGE
jgi:hypothetical protein